MMLAWLVLRSLSTAINVRTLRPGRMCAAPCQCRRPGECAGKRLVGVVADQLAVDLERDAPDAVGVAGGDADRQRAGVSGVIGGRGDVNRRSAEVPALFGELIAVVGVGLHRGERGLVRAVGAQQAGDVGALVLQGEPDRDLDVGVLLEAVVGLGEIGGLLLFGDTLRLAPGPESFFALRRRSCATRARSSRSACRRRWRASRCGLRGRRGTSRGSCARRFRAGSCRGRRCCRRCRCGRRRHRSSPWRRPGRASSRNG